ncbi:MAG: PEGA domain-containing protein [Spirochaetaceae bacterium]|jgi:hypothetical protein|nr:PEGA domain-containing protein [Spirochaetaceae bacterium]
MKIIASVLICVMVMGCSTTSKVNIRTNVPGASVVVDGRDIGQTPLESIEIKNKSEGYRVIIEKEGYETYTGTLAKETKAGPMAAVIIGYAFCWALLPALLLLYIPYVDGPTSDQYFVLKEVPQS